MRTIIDTSIKTTNLRVGIIQNPTGVATLLYALQIARFISTTINTIGVALSIIQQVAEMSMPAIRRTSTCWWENDQIVVSGSAQNKFLRQTEGPISAIIAGQPERKQTNRLHNNHHKHDNPDTNSHIIIEIHVGTIPLTSQLVDFGHRKLDEWQSSVIKTIAVEPKVRHQTRVNTRR